MSKRVSVERFQIEELWKRLPKNEARIGNYLDVGCADCSMTEVISNIVGAGKTYGVDTSEMKVPDWVEKRKIEDIGDDSMDMVSTFMSMHHFEKREEMIKSIIRVLRQGGYWMIKEHDVQKTSPLTVPFLDCIHHIYEKNNGECRNFTAYTSKDDLMTELKGYGFEIVASMSVKCEQMKYRALLRFKTKGEIKYTPAEVMTCSTYSFEKGNMGLFERRCPPAMYHFLLSLRLRTGHTKSFDLIKISDEDDSTNPTMPHGPEMSKPSSKDQKWRASKVGSNTSSRKESRMKGSFLLTPVKLPTEKISWRREE